MHSFSFLPSQLFSQLFYEGQSFAQSGLSSSNGQPFFLSNEWKNDQTSEWKYGQKKGWKLGNVTSAVSKDLSTICNYWH
jgi:hypothetical protein